MKPPAEMAVPVSEASVCHLIQRRFRGRVRSLRRVHGVGVLVSACLSEELPTQVGRCLLMWSG